MSTEQNSLMSDYIKKNKANISYWLYWTIGKLNTLKKLTHPTKYQQVGLL